MAVCFVKFVRIISVFMVIAKDFFGNIRTNILKNLIHSKNMLLFYVFFVQKEQTFVQIFRKEDDVFPDFSRCFGEI